MRLLLPVSAAIALGIVAVLLAHASSRPPAWLEARAREENALLATSSVTSGEQQTVPGAAAGQTIDVVEP